MADTAILEVTLDADFLAAAEAAEREPSQIVADLMREFVERERSGYLEFLRRKVERGRRDYREGRWHTDEEVEKEFAALRSSLLTEGRDSAT